MSTVTVTDADVARVRGMSAADVTDYPNESIAEIIATTVDSDLTLNYDRAAAHVWQRKAAAYADLVDVTEGNSSRKMAQAHKNALAMVEYYEGRATASVNGNSRGNVVIGSIAPRVR